MSTNLYLECISHTPVIDTAEISQYMSALDEILDAFRKRDELASAIEIFVNLFHEVPVMDDYTAKCAVFFRNHPKCNIHVIDEYGNVHHTDIREERE